MNRERRKRIDALNLEHVLAELESLRDEEREAFDNMPESMQDGERGARVSECADALETIADAVQEFLGVEL